MLTPADHAMLLTTTDHFLASSAIGADGIVMLGQGEGGRVLAQVVTLGCRWSRGASRCRD